MTLMSLPDAIALLPYPRAMTALVAAMLTVLIDLVLRFRDYHALLPSISLSGIMKFLGTFALAFMQVVSLFYLITILPGPVLAVVLLFAVFIVIVQLSYWLTLSQFMTSTDLFLSLTCSGNHRIGAILSFFKPRVLLYALPYALILSLLVMAPPVPSVSMTLTLCILPMLYLAFSNYICFIYVPERNFHLNPLTSFLRSIIHFTFETRRKYSGPRDDLPPFFASHIPLDSIIYVIDESVRGSNLSLNGYPRDTTPFLQSLETRGRLKNLGICVAAASFTHISNAYLITGHNAFPDTAYRTEKNPTIFDYAKTMGYKTIYVDINRVCLSSLKKAAGNGHIRSLDQWMSDHSFRERKFDLDTTMDLCVARFISDLLNESSGYFILVNKQGLHFHYGNNYPDDMSSAIWKPVMKVLESIDPGETGRERLVNTYDNGIRFQVDEFFRTFVSETANQNYVLLYTSDHGQTLAEHGQVYTHMKPDQEIVDVPGFLVSGESYSRKGLIDSISPGIRVSHLNNFATLLDLMDVPMSLRIRPYDKSVFALTSDDNNERYYMSGSLHGSGDYVVAKIGTPPSPGWGISRPVNNGTGRIGEN